MWASILDALGGHRAPSMLCLLTADLGADGRCAARAGTLTLNQLSVDKDTCMVQPPHSLDDVLKWGALSANIMSEEPIDVVLHEAYPGGH